MNENKNQSEKGKPEFKDNYKGMAYYTKYTDEILDLFYHRFYEQYTGNATLEDKKEAFYEWLNEQIKNTTY